ncbi:unnamed protein product [Urochloa humidicola]
MGNSPSATAVPALCFAVGALELANHLDPQQQQAGAGTAAAPLGGAARTFLPLVALGSFCASVALLHSHLRRAGNQRRLPEYVAFPLCASAGSLIAALAPAQGGVDRDAARALGLAALRAVPAVSAVTFFLGMLLVIVGHIRAGGEGGGGAAVAGEGPIGAHVLRILTKAATASTAALLCLTAIAVCFMI